ncbi:MAG: MetQ/NlpA family ABC transporter substrate-binding protein [Finegoldia sp.]|nr:MetQ/NlpA family ABC transporter substrate-binding protein [Finegoldia sp.]
MKKLVSALAVVALLFTACGNSQQEGAATETKNEQAAQGEQNNTDKKDGSKVVIGVSPAPHAAIAEFVKGKLAEEGIELEIKEFDDYVQPNISLDEGELDLNFFQHKPYLDEFNQTRGTKIVSLGGVHLEPMGIYSKNYKSLDEVKDGDKVVIPNDATNGARALVLLEGQGLIKLKEGVGINATEEDIAENPKNLEFTAVEAASIPRVYDDAAIAVINSNYAIEAGLSPKDDTLAIESTQDNPYANIIAVKEGEENNETYKKVYEAFTSKETKDFIESTYKGEIVPVQ